jgi:hypothetical protein
MALRAFLLILLSAFLISSLGRATDTAALPSRKAAVVLPLLKQFSKREGYPKIEKILGKPDMDIGSGLFIYVFRLDDFTTVSVSSPDGKSVFSIRRAGRNITGTQVLFQN